MVVVVDGSVSGGTNVVTVVDEELVDVELLDVVVTPGTVVVAPGTVVVAAGALVTVKPVVASSVVLKACTVAAPAAAEGGTDTVPENDGEPLESAVPMRVAFPDWTKSMMMQFGLSDAHGW